MLYLNSQNKEIKVLRKKMIKICQPLLEFKRSKSFIHIKSFIFISLSKKLETTEFNIDNDKNVKK